MGSCGGLAIESDAVADRGSSVEPEEAEFLQGAVEFCEKLVGLGCLVGTREECLHKWTRDSYCIDERQALFDCGRQGNYTCEPNRHFVWGPACSEEVEEYDACHNH